jgi:hypothetical protein
LPPRGISSSLPQAASHSTVTTSETRGSLRPPRRRV